MCLPATARIFSFVDRVIVLTSLYLAKTSSGVQFPELIHHYEQYVLVLEGLCGFELGFDFLPTNEQGFRL